MSLAPHQSWRGRGSTLGGKSCPGLCCLCPKTPPPTGRSQALWVQKADHGPAWGRSLVSGRGQTPPNPGPCAADPEATRLGSQWASRSSHVFPCVPGCVRGPRPPEQSQPRS